MAQYRCWVDVSSSRFGSSGVPVSGTGRVDSLDLGWLKKDATRSFNKRCSHELEA